MQHATIKQTALTYLKHIKAYRLGMAGLIAAVTLGTISRNIPALYYKKFFDVLAEPGLSLAAARDVLVHILVIIGVISLANWLIQRIVDILSTRLETGITVDLYVTCFSVLHRHSFAFFNNNFVGSLVKRVNRFVGAFSLIMDQMFFTLIPLLVNIIMVSVVLSRRAAVLGVVIVVWVVVFLAINWWLSRLKSRYDIAHNEADSKVSGHLADTVTNNANVKLFNGLRHETDTFKGLLIKARNLQRIRWDLNSVFEAVQGLLVIGLELGIFYGAIRLWQEGRLTTGDFVLIQAYVITLVNEIWGFGRVIRRLSEAMADASEMTAVMLTPYEIQDAPNAGALSVTQGSVQFKNVTFNYSGKRSMFENLSLDIKPGEKVALVGPSGSGKSTLIKLLLRMYDINDGSIIIDGQDIKDVTQESLWNMVSLVPQDPVLFHRTIMENIRYGRPNASDDEVIAAAKAAHCHEFITRLPDGYSTVAGERGLKLSGGERQRIAIARAILRNAPILVLDEATSSLDSESEHLIQDALDHVMDGKTVIVIAHRLSTIMQMDRIVVLKNGKLLEDGTHADLTKRGGLYADLWKLQAGGFIE